MTSERPGELSWSLIEPYWERISIYDGADTFRREFDRTPGVVANLFAGHWCVTEVRNGGFHQLFWNSTGVLAPEAAAAFEQIQLPDLASTVREAIAFFPEPYPRDREVRQLTLEAYEQEHPDHHRNPARRSEALPLEGYRVEPHPVQPTTCCRATPAGGECTDRNQTSS
jgi:hypothetical protein